MEVPPVSLSAGERGEATSLPRLRKATVQRSEDGKKSAPEKYDCNVNELKSSPLSD